MIDDEVIDVVPDVVEEKQEDVFLAELSGTRGSLTEAQARTALYEIVNNDQLNLIEKENWLDALFFKVCNCHEAGMAAEIIEDIQNEGTHLRYPEWCGRHGDWHSLQQKIEKV